MRPHVVVVLAFVLLSGCNRESYQVTTVSGRVTLDGKPLVNGHVTFMPMASKENQAPGPTAWGPTGADGRYTLSVDPDTPGSVVGKCRVFISGLHPNKAPVDEDQDVGGRKKMARDPVPEKYNRKTELVYDVPPGGTNEANFDLKSR